MGHTKTVSRSIIDDLCHRHKHLERRVQRLENVKRRAIPIYDKAHLPNALPDGTIFFTADTKEFGLVINGQIFYSKTKPHAI